ncbi:hypothetical protein ACJMK2_026827 [Sinanodonta woodiana]|uniref:Tetraspanin n=1 Tax=Sinanodonta woodiana TaxID=1069815 RepID=A0ABD3XL00_SINWO
MGMVLLVVKGLTIILNTIITLAALVMLGFGALLKFGTEMLSGYMVPLMKTLPTGHSTDAWTLFNSTAIVFMTLGSICLVLGGIGCSAVLCPSRVAVLIYIVAVVVVMTGEISIALLLYTTDTGDNLKSSLRADLVAHYAGDDSQDKQSKAWNYIFVQFDCCGVTNYLDLKAAINWNGKKTVNGTEFTMKTPTACCKVTGVYPGYDPPSDVYCDITPTDDNSYYMKGCYEKVKKYLFDYSLIIIAGGGGMISIEIVSLVLAVVIFRSLRKKVRPI